MSRKNEAAVALGRRGGRAKSAAKARASRENALRPRTAKHPCPKCGYAARKTAGGFACQRCGLKWLEGQVSQALKAYRKLDEREKKEEEVSA